MHAHTPTPAANPRPSTSPTCQAGAATGGNGGARPGQQFGAVPATGTAIGQQLPHPVKILTRLSIRMAQEHGQRQRHPGSVQPLCRTLSSARVFEGAFYPRAIFDNYLRRVPGASPPTRCWRSAARPCGATWNGTKVRGFLIAGPAGGERAQRRAHALIGNRIAINQIELHIPGHLSGGRVTGHLRRQPRTAVHRELGTHQLRLRSCMKTCRRRCWPGWGSLSNRKTAPTGR